MSRAPVKFTTEQELNFKTRYANGETLQVLSKEVGCSPATMSRKLKELGCHIRRRGRPVGQKHPTPPVEVTASEERLPPELQSNQPQDSRFEW